MHVITVVYQYFEPSKMIPHPKLDLRVFSIASFFYNELHLETSYTSSTQNTKQAERSSHHLLCLLLDVCWSGMRVKIPLLFLQRSLSGLSYFCWETAYQNWCKLIHELPQAYNVWFWEKSHHYFSCFHYCFVYFIKLQ